MTKQSEMKPYITIVCVAVGFVTMVSFGQFMMTQEFAALMQDLKDISIYIAILALIIALSVR